MRHLNIAARLIVLIFTLLFSAQTALAADVPSKEALRQTLKELLQQHPELVLDVLRDNSEMVLEIAQQGGTLRRKKTLMAQWLQDMNIPKSVGLKERPFRGDAKAPVRVVAFSDFTCPYCRQADLMIRQAMAGPSVKFKLYFKYLPLESHPNARLAAEYSIAAFMQDEAKGWALFDEFFENPLRITKDGDPYMRQAAKDAGLDVNRLLKDVKNPKVKAQLEEDQKDAETLDITGTPCFLVNDIVVKGALPMDLFMEAVNLAATKASQEKK